MILTVALKTNSAMVEKVLKDTVWGQKCSSRGPWPLSTLSFSLSVFLLSRIYSMYMHMSVSNSILVRCQWSVLSGWRMLLARGKHLLQETVCVCMCTMHISGRSHWYILRGLLAKKGSWVKFTVACVSWALICDPPVFVFCGSAILSSGWMDDTCPPRFVYMAAFFQARNMIECNYYKCGLTSELRLQGQGAKAISWPPCVFGQRMNLEDDICVHMCVCIGVGCDNICVHVMSQSMTVSIDWHAVLVWNVFVSNDATDYVDT